MAGRDDIAAAILRLTEERGPAKSICPSEVARALEPGEAAWRRLLAAVRLIAIELAKQGRIEVLRKGKPVGPGGDVRGVIRLRIRSS